MQVTNLDRAPARVEVAAGAARLCSARRSSILLLAAAVILLNAFGNLSLTWGLQQLSERLATNPAGYASAMLHPFVALGVAMLILWLLTRMALMSWADLSFVLPVTSLGYILAAVLGRIFLAENVSGQHWLGILLIFAGAALVGSSRHLKSAEATGPRRQTRGRTSADLGAGRESVVREFLKSARPEGEVR